MKTQPAYLQSALRYSAPILEGDVEVILGNRVDDTTSQEPPRRCTPQFTSIFVIHIQKLYRADTNGCQSRASVTPNLEVYVPVLSTRMKQHD